MSDFDEPVPYDATAVRPAYETLPAAVQARIEKELGGRPTAITMAGGGFTGGFAAKLRTESGAELFIKAVGADKPYVHRAYVQEARINPALPEGLPAPRLEFSVDVADWTVLGFEAVEGRALALPMSAESLQLMLNAWAEAAALLTPAPQQLLDLGVSAVPIDESLQRFKGVAAGDVAPFWLPPALEGRVDQLAELDAGIDEALQADSVMHFDLRPDNMILGTDRAWICDWNWLQVHATWFDTACFLVAAHGDGHDAESLFWSHPTAKGVSQDQLDTGLAAITGYYLAQSMEDLIPGVSPYIRKHQRWSGIAVADWLAARRGWN
ncbi:phosphotransferase [Glycomyces buryatensis]|nr:phosphotransferase [Glycomyces buryatensis]